MDNESQNILSDAPNWKIGRLTIYCERQRLNQFMNKAATGAEKNVTKQNMVPNKAKILFRTSFSLGMAHNAFYMR